MAMRKKTKLIRTINLKRLLMCVGVIVFALYFSVTFLEQQRRINNNTLQIAEIQVQTEEAFLQNAILQETLSQVGTDEHIERVARERGFAMPGDRIYIDAARNR